MSDEKEDIDAGIELERPVDDRSRSRRDFCRLVLASNVDNIVEIV